MVCAHACPAGGTFNLIIFGFGYLPYNLVIDAVVKEVLFIYELYVNFFSRRLEFFGCDHTIYYSVQLGRARAVLYGLLSPPYYLRRNQALKALSQDILPYSIFDLELRAYFQGKVNEIFIKKRLSYFNVQSSAKIAD